MFTIVNFDIFVNVIFMFAVSLLSENIVNSNTVFKAVLEGINFFHLNAGKYNAVAHGDWIFF